jgi:phosphonate transport system substrate-binding protein
MKRYIVLLFLIFIGLSSPAIADEAVKLSMLPRFFPEKIMSMITPLAAYLSEKTGMNIKPVLTKNFAEYANELKNGNIVIGYENPVVYVQVSGTHEVLAMATKGAGGDKFRGIIISRPDSGIEGVKDLKHKKIMVVGPTSAGGLLSQKITLTENGFDIDTDCQIEVATDNKQENVIISVSIGDSDAGFIRESALHQADKYIQPGTIAVIAETAWLPNWAFSVNRSMPAEKKQSIKKALLELKKDSDVMKAMELDGFNAASDSDYDVLRKVIGK